MTAELSHALSVFIFAGVRHFRRVASWTLTTEPTVSSSSGIVATQREFVAGVDEAGRGPLAGRSSPPP